jgi:hypothetical protein
MEKNERTLMRENGAISLRAPFANEDGGMEKEGDTCPILCSHKDIVLTCHSLACFRIELPRD